MRKNIGILGTIAAVLLSAVPALAGNWLSIEPAQNLKKNQPTVRLQGGNGSNFYGWADIDNLEDEPSVYGEARLSEPIGEDIDFVLELDADYNADFKNTFRSGLGIKPSKNTVLRYLPWETFGKYGPQLCFYGTQDLSDRLQAALIMDYNIDSETTYFEPGLSYKVNDDVSAFVQGRYFGALEDLAVKEMDAVVGVSIGF